jgi:hypothetical protein
MQNDVRQRKENEVRRKEQQQLEQRNREIRAQEQDHQRNRDHVTFNSSFAVPPAALPQRGYVQQPLLARSPPALLIPSDVPLGSD